ncbi:hypothetical protein [Mycobacterium nebraskense]|nr:hypothetical protein [Mycobacterium nebraskense]
MFSLSGSPGDEAAQRAEVDELAVAEGLGDLAAHRLAVVTREVVDGVAA